MYTLENLQQKNLKELKEIGWQLHVMPEGDKRCRQNWIDAVACVNPPLLQLLEVSPAAEEVELGAKAIAPAAKTKKRAQKPIEVQATEPIALAAKNSPGVKVEQAQEPIVPVAKTSAEKVSSSKKVKANSYLDCPSCGIGRLRVKQSIYWETSCTKCGYFAESILYPFTPAVTGYKVGDWVKLRIKPRLATNIRRGEVVCIEKVQDDYLRFVNPNLNPALVIWARRQFLHPHEVFPCEPPFVKAAETSPGVKTEATVSESAIVPVVKNHIEEESDRNPILTGIVFSDSFLACYAPPQAEIFHFKSDADGQLSLTDFTVESEPEPPDPDDFKTLEEFREAIARWDWEHPSSFDHFSDLPSSVHCQEPNSVQDESPLEVSLDSFCLWAPCPYDWYEPHTLLEPSKVLELSPARKSSSTSDFFIPTFDRKGDRTNGSDESDEPPDTWGIFARLPKPKPPKFPPQTASQSQVNHKLTRYPETISSHRRWHQHPTSPIATRR